MKKTEKLKVGVIGGFGLMSSPMARHWKNSEHIQVVRVLDRGRTDSRSTKIRNQWIESAARCVPDLATLFGDGELDGFFICVGKNGDDLPILLDLARRIKKSHRSNTPFLCHLSTVSVRFVDLAQNFFRSLEVPYANYPLTGGPAGAENANMLILAAGEKEQFEQLENALKQIGNPKYFGPRASAGTDVKLMGHMMVFNGLMGICSATAVHSEKFQDGKIGGINQAEFFDYLNQGAGGTRQWDVILSKGIKSDIWDQPFFARYALLDSFYTAELMLSAGLADISVHSLLNVSAALLSVVRKDPTLASHAILKELVGMNAGELNLKTSQTQSQSPKERLKILIDSLSPDLKKSLFIDISQDDFCLAN